MVNVDSPDGAMAVTVVLRDALSGATMNLTKKYDGQKFTMHMETRGAPAEWGPSTSKSLKHVNDILENKFRLPVTRLQGLMVEQNSVAIVCESPLDVLKFFEKVAKTDILANEVASNRERLRHLVSKMDELETERKRLRSKRAQAVPGLMRCKSLCAEQKAVSVARLKLCENHINLLTSSCTVAETQIRDAQIKCKKIEHDLREAERRVSSGRMEERVARIEAEKAAGKYNELMKSIVSLEGLERAAMKRSEEARRKIEEAEKREKYRATAVSCGYVYYGFYVLLKRQRNMLEGWLKEIGK